MLLFTFSKSKKKPATYKEMEVNFAPLTSCEHSGSRRTVMFCGPVCVPRPQRLLLLFVVVLIFRLSLLIFLRLFAEAKAWACGTHSHRQYV